LVAIVGPNESTESKSFTPTEKPMWKALASLQNLPAGKNNKSTLRISSWKLWGNSLRLEDTA